MILQKFSIALPRYLHKLRKQLPLVLEDGENRLRDYPRILLHELYSEWLRLDDRIIGLPVGLSTSQARESIALINDTPGLARQMTGPEAYLLQTSRGATPNMTIPRVRHRSPLDLLMVSSLIHLTL